MLISVQVAVAVIVYQQQYLLGFRHASQHQGNRYEFVGGKIADNETPYQALIREVQEEIGCDIHANAYRKMGIIHHDYIDKQVSLHIFMIMLNETQYQDLQGQIGAEGQKICWVEKDELLAKKYPLPDANQRILDWLMLPEQIFITKSLTEFPNISEWSNFYQQKLPKNSLVYVRPKDNRLNNSQSIADLQQQRPDLMVMASLDVASYLWKQVDICHLTHEMLLDNCENLPKNVHYFASCHDEQSIEKVNELAKTHTVMGIFLSPVKETPTHPNVVGMGWQKFAKLAKLSDVPVFALGGVTADDLTIAWQHGAFGVAGIRLLSFFDEKC